MLFDYASLIGAVGSDKILGFSQSLKDAVTQALHDKLSSAVTSGNRGQARDRGQERGE